MKNWKTTVAAVITAALYAWANSNQQGKQLVVAVAIAAFGVVCKDFNISGS